MYQYLRPYPTLVKVELYGSDAERAGWLVAARREGHRLFEEEDEEGARVMMIWISGHEQVEELSRLMRKLGIDGSFVAKRGAGWETGCDRVLKPCRARRAPASGGQSFFFAALNSVSASRRRS
jgi:hypothetical protein